MSVMMRTAASCTDCGFTTRDTGLLKNHSCDVQEFGSQCEDYPCCEHERGDCNGLLYGSDEAIKEQVEIAWRTGHGYCEHEAGIYNCEDEGEEDE